MGKYAHFSKDLGPWEESTQVLWGCHDICPSLTQFQVVQVTQPELSVLSHPGAWGDPGKPQCNKAFLLKVPGKVVEGEVAFRLITVWMHLHQACLSSLDEVIKLTLLINLGDNWAYTFVQLNKDAQNVALSDKGYLSTMIDVAPCRSVCGCLCQLEVCKLLQHGDQVVYQEGLNGGLGTGANLTIRITCPGHR